MNNVSNLFANLVLYENLLSEENIDLIKDAKDKMTHKDKNGALRNLRRIKMNETHIAILRDFNNQLMQPLARLNAIKAAAASTAAPSAAAPSNSAAAPGNSAAAWRPRFFSSPERNAANKKTRKGRKNRKARKTRSR